MRSRVKRDNTHAADTRRHGESATSYVCMCMCRGTGLHSTPQQLLHCHQGINTNRQLTILSLLEYAATFFFIRRSFKRNHVENAAASCTTTGPRPSRLSSPPEPWSTVGAGDDENKETTAASCASRVQYVLESVECGRWHSLLLLTCNDT